jgi:hypothetical protein
MKVQQQVLNQWQQQEVPDTSPTSPANVLSFLCRPPGKNPFAVNKNYITLYYISNSLLAIIFHCGLRGQGAELPFIMWIPAPIVSKAIYRSRNSYLQNNGILAL